MAKFIRVWESMGEMYPAPPKQKPADPADLRTQAKRTVEQHRKIEQGVAAALQPADPADPAASVLTWVDKQRKRKGDNLWTHATDDDLARIEACALIARET